MDKREEIIEGAEKRNVNETFIDFFNVGNKNAYIKQPERNVIFTIGRALYIDKGLKDNLPVLKLLVKEQETSSSTINRVMKDFQEIQEKTGENIYESIIKQNETEWRNADLFKGIYGASYAVDALNKYRENQERNK